MDANEIARAIANGKHHWSTQELEATDGLLDAFILAHSAGLIDGLYINRPGQVPQTYRAPDGVYVSGLTPLGDESTDDEPD